MSDRPYTEAQVFDLEMHVDQLVAKAMAPDRKVWQEMGAETMENILYDALIALREVMIDEEDSRG